MAERFSSSGCPGRAGKLAWLVPGSPTLLLGQRALLFIHPLKEPGEYGLSEFALSKFDVLEDSDGSRYAVRSTFKPAEERKLSARF